MTSKPEERPPPYAPPPGGYGTTQPPPTYNETTRVPQGYPQYTGTGYQPGYQPLPTQPQPVHVSSNVVLIGGCPVCRTGYLEDQYTLAGILLALLFFPLGLICCLLMREKRCTQCGASFPA